MSDTQRTDDFLTHRGHDGIEQFTRGLERENTKLRAAIKLADEMHLGRCASSEPFTAQDYRNHACEARNILRSASANTANHARSPSHENTK